jgi:hypothetical protein
MEITEAFKFSAHDCFSFATGWLETKGENADELAARLSGSQSTF